MKIVSWMDFVAGTPSSPLAVTIGVFDGVHRGHQRLLATVLAQRPRMTSCVVTFRENPKKVLHPQAYRGSIFNLEQKLAYFEACGIEVCVLIDFSQNFGTLSGVEFLSSLSRAGVKFVCVGPNFRCGHKMDTNAVALVKICSNIGIDAKIVEPVLHGGHPVSSSRIRNAILEAKLHEAEIMLGRPYELFVHGGEDSGTQGYVFSMEADAIVPPDGLYRVGLDAPGRDEIVEARIAGGKIFVDTTIKRALQRIAILEAVSKE